MKIVQFGLHYSPNVGDGIISETLGHAIRTLNPAADYRTIDISGRAEFGETPVRNRALALRLLGLMPGQLRGRVVEARLNRLLDRVEPVWRDALDGADLAIIGGGQVFSDADLNFCVKIARAAELIRAADVPVAIHAAGVAGNWSVRGARLFSRIFETDLRAIGLRDGLSIENWSRQTAGRGRDPHLARDPGLLAASCYGPPAARTDQIALCITDPHLLRYHSDSAVTGATGLAFFQQLIVELARRGHAILLFCNGAVEDRAALNTLARTPDIASLIASGDVGVAPAPETPADLAALIRPCKAVIAHRMHASIVAYSYGLAIVGLGWDRKLESFFASVECQAGFVGAAETSAAQVIDIAESRIAARHDPVRHQQALRETRDAVARLLSLV